MLALTKFVASPTYNALELKYPDVSIPVVVPVPSIVVVIIPLALTFPEAVT